ncbi:MAG: 3-dehydroquinate synthase, partial [Dokdonella sp.]|nr:3-dehydroquinate synthase [Dokdonella sp.]
MSAVRTLDVALGARSYPIWIGAGLLADSARWRAPIRGRHVLVVTNTTVAALYLQRVLAGLAGLQHAHLVLPDGEAHKTLDASGQIFAALAALGASRDATILALGGGVIGDLAGFVAASVRRGLDFVQVPTTLLAQVDSSVGGKTGINSAQGKNLIGAFHQPVLVIADTALLDTLPQRDFRAGYAEVAKYGLINDPDFFSWLETNWRAVAAGWPEREYAIAVSCRAKAATVAADERESGVRALLNFGHTFGHALEAWAGYS